MINKKMTLLFDACNSGNVAYILNNLDFENINYTYCDKRTLLHIACLNNDKLMIDALLKFLPNTNLEDKNGLLPIFHLIKNNNLEYVIELIERAHCVLVNEKLFEALMICCLYDNVEIFDYLYNKLKFNLHITDIHGNNLLMFATKYGSQKIFNYLIKNNFDINISNNEGNTPLFFSIISNNYSSFKELIKKSDINHTNNYGINALMLSILYDRLTIFSELLNKGADIFIFDKNANNLFHYIISSKNLEFMAMLLNKDSSMIKFNNNLKISPLNILSDFDDEDDFKIKAYELLSLEIKKHDTNNDIQILNNINDEEHIKNLILEKENEILLMITENEKIDNTIYDEKANDKIISDELNDNYLNNEENIIDDDISEIDIDKDYILNEEIDESIFDLSNVIDNSHNDSLINNVILLRANNMHHSIKNVIKDFMLDDEMKLSDDINDNTRNDNNYKGLSFVSKNINNKKESECNMSKVGNMNIKWLINENEIKEIKNKQKGTYMNTIVKISPVIYFSKIGKTKELFELLKEDGRRAHDKTCSGKTALMYASQYNNYNCGRLLLLVGANVNAIDENGSTALHYATFMGNYEMVKLLVDNGATISIQDNNGITPIHIATKQENEKILSLLITYCNEGVINPTKKIAINEVEYI